MSLNPRNTPCIANERRTAGAPRDLNVRYCCAGFSIGEPCINIMYYILIIPSWYEYHIWMNKIKLMQKLGKKKETLNVLLIIITVVLTDFTPMKFNKGFAADMRNIAWMMPRMPPITSADEAEGMYLFLCSVLTLLKPLPAKSELWTSPPVSIEKMEGVLICHGIKCILVVLWSNNKLLQRMSGSP